MFGATLEGAFGALIGGAGEDNFNDALNDVFGPADTFFGPGDDFLFFNEFGFGEDDLLFLDDDVTEDDLLLFLEGGDTEAIIAATQIELTGGSGNDIFDASASDPSLQITSSAERITTGAGYDQVRYTNAGEMLGDTIADFTVYNAADSQYDTLQLDGYGFASNNTALHATGGGDASAFQYSSASGSASFQTVSTSLNIGNMNAGRNILMFVDSTYDSASTIQSRIQSGGDTEFSFSYTTHTGAFLALYDNGTDSKLAAIQFESASSTANATVTDLITFEGVSDVTTFSATDFNFIWSGAA